MPPSAVGTNSLAGQATTHSRVLQSAQMAPSTTMCACSLTSKRVVPIRSSNPISGHSFTAIRSPEGPPAGEAVLDQVASTDAEALALAPEERAQPRLGAWVVDPEHPLHPAGDE